MTSAQMPDGRPLEREIEALEGVDRPPVGRYRLDIATGEWAWSDEIYVMHGFQPGEIVPTTPLMLAHKHPEDRGRVDGLLQRAASTGQPFSSVHRIVDAQGTTRTLAVTGQGRRDPATGSVTELFGYFLDLTDSHREAAAREATAAIRASAERRAVIEQAKGVLMMVYGVTAEASFELLRQSSNMANIAVRDIAESLVHSFAGAEVTLVPTREAIDEFLAAPVPRKAEALSEESR